MTFRSLLMGAILSCISGAILLAFACSSKSDLEISRLFQEAQDQFNKAESPGDFLVAADLYEKILDKGFVSGAVLYNLGNAYMQGDQRGNAIAAFRRAERYRPRDPYLAANLQYALGADGTLETRSLVDHILFWKEWLSYPEKCSLSLALAGLTLLLALGVLLSRKKRLLRRLRLFSLLLFILMALSALYDFYRFDYLDHGVVTASEVVARKGNGETWEPALTQPLKEGTEFLVKEQRGDWLLIRLKSGPEGWIPAEEASLF